MITDNEYRELQQLCAKGYRAMDSNLWIYFYKACLKKNPPNCQCSYGMMAIELKDWLEKNKRS